MPNPSLVPIINQAFALREKELVLALQALGQPDHPLLPYFRTYLADQPFGRNVMEDAGYEVVENRFVRNARIAPLLGATRDVPATARGDILAYNPWIPLLLGLRDWRDAASWAEVQRDGWHGLNLPPRERVQFFIRIHFLLHGWHSYGSLALQDNSEGLMTPGAICGFLGLSDPKEVARYLWEEWALYGRLHCVPSQCGGYRVGAMVAHLQTQSDWAASYRLADFWPAGTASRAHEAAHEYDQEPWHFDNTLYQQVWERDLLIIPVPGQLQFNYPLVRPAPQSIQRFALGYAARNSFVPLFRAPDDTSNLPPVYPWEVVARFKRAMVCKTVPEALQPDFHLLQT